MADHMRREDIEEDRATMRSLGLVVLGFALFTLVLATSVGFIMT